MPRAELFAVIVLVGCIVVGGEVCVVSDSAVTVAGVMSGKRGGDNADLWLQLWALVAARDVRLEARWVKAHTFEDELKTGGHLTGNKS